MDKPKMLIATPTTDQVHADYCASLALTIQHLHRQGVETDYLSVSGSPPVAEKRDWLAHRFLQGNDTHLLFIDSDMAFAQDLAFRLLRFEKDLIGAIGTRRRINLEAYADAIERGQKRDIALALAHEFVFLPDRNGQITVAGDLCRVGAMGAAFLLISRQCVERLTPTVESYESFASDRVAGLFARIQRPNEQALGHDYSFCRRWCETGGEVWADLHAKIWHCGTMRYGVGFQKYLAASLGHTLKAASRKGGDAG